MHRIRPSFLVRLALVLCAVPALASPPATKTPVPGKTPSQPEKAAPAAAPAATPSAPADDSDTLYGIGLAISRNLAAFDLTEKELKLVEEGLADGVLGRKPRVELESAMPRVQALLAARMKAAADTEKAAGAAYLEKAAAEPGTKRMPSGFLYRETRAGTGAMPASTDTVTVHYTGKLLDGTVFDSSVERNQPATFALNQVIACWSQGVPLMKEGGKAQLVCPSDLAYGDGGRPKIKPGATLLFEVELISVKKPEAVATPAPVTAAPPAAAATPTPAKK